MGYFQQTVCLLHLAYYPVQVPVHAGILEKVNYGLLSTDCLPLTFSLLSSSSACSCQCRFPWQIQECGQCSLFHRMKAAWSWPGACK